MNKIETIRLYDPNEDESTTESPNGNTNTNTRRSAITDNAPETNLTTDTMQRFSKRIIRTYKKVAAKELNEDHRLNKEATWKRRIHKPKERNERVRRNEVNTNELTRLNKRDNSKATATERTYDERTPHTGEQTQLTFDLGTIRRERDDIITKQKSERNNG